MGLSRMGEAIRDRRVCEGRVQSIECGWVVVGMD